MLATAARHKIHEHFDTPAWLVRGLSLEPMTATVKEPRMFHFTHHEAPIPGTYIFDGQAAMKGYTLNKMCYSFNSTENRAAFLKDEDAYCSRFGITGQQRAAIHSRDVLTLIRSGGCIYYLAKFAGIFGLTVQDVGAQQTGMTVEAFKKKIKAYGE
jgi:protocatechuate 4,5-dioxygenase, alpha chain